jgi:hypothetical protein
VVAGPAAAGPRTRSNNTRSCADPIRRRAWDSAEAVRGGHRNSIAPVEASDQPPPHLCVAELGEQPGREQEIDHHPRGQIPDPRLNRAGLRQRGIDQVERHDPGQLTEMTRREPATSSGHDTSDDRIGAQRSSS